MTISRRTTLQTIGALGAGTALASSSVYAIGEHDDDDRDDDDDDDEVDTEPDTDAPTAGVRVAHLSPDAPDVDVLVDGDQVLADVTYSEVTPYLEIDPGTYTVTITAAGDPDTVVFDEEVSFGRGFFTVAAIGELEADTFRALVLTDAGSALVRLVHASPDAPAVDVTGGEGAFTLFGNVSFGQSTNYVAVPAGSYTLDVVPATGEDDDAGGTPPDMDDEDENDYDDDEDGDDYDDEDEEMDDEAEDDPVEDDPVATVDVDLEEDTAYSALAIGYLEPDTAQDDREFEVSLVVDGPGADEDPAVDEDEDVDEEVDDEEEMDDDEEVDDEYDDDEEMDDDYDDDDDEEEMDDDYDDDDDEEEMDDDYDDDDEKMDDDYDDDDDNGY